MHRFSVLVALLLALAVSACNPFYSVEQADVERGYRWISRGDYDRAISTFQHALSNDPNSGLAHLGMADAFAESRRELNAVDMYTKALPLLSAAGHTKIAASEPQAIGERFFSYQNQGLAFPHGVAAYVYLRRGIVYEALARRYPNRVAEYRAAAVADYGTAFKLAPDWTDPKERLACLNDSPPSECKK